MAIEKSKKVQFSWTEEETALLLKVVLDYKVSKLAGGQDWETVRTKYEDITSKFQALYPEEADSVAFPHLATKKEFSKERLTAKIKKIKTSFRKAVDSGRQSGGGGGVVFALYNECYEIWAGCPAAESISEGVETALVNNISVTNKDESSCTESSPSEAPASVVESTESESTEQQEDDSEEVDIEPLKKKMKTKRDELAKVLSERRNSKATKQISFQEQMLAMTKEDVAMRAEDMKIKQRLADQYEASERQFNQSMEQFSATMSRTMTEGFQMMMYMFQQSGPMQFQPPAPSFTNGWGSQNINERRQQSFPNEPTYDKSYTDLS